MNVSVENSPRKEERGRMQKIRKTWSCNVEQVELWNSKTSTLFEKVTYEQILDGWRCPGNPKIMSVSLKSNPQ